MFLDFNPWWTSLKEFARDKKNLTRWQDFSNTEDFNIILSDFLFSTRGANYKPNFKWDGELVCNKPAPPIMVIFLEEFLTLGSSFSVTTNFIPFI